MGLACLRSKQTWWTKYFIQDSTCSSLSDQICSTCPVLVQYLYATKQAQIRIKLLESCRRITSFEGAEGAEVTHQVQQIVSCSCENIPGNVSVFVLKKSPSIKCETISLIKGEIHLRGVPGWCLNWIKSGRDEMPGQLSSVGVPRAW